MLRFSIVSILYFVQGVSLGVMTIALPAFMYTKGISTKETSVFMGLILLPWVFKFLAAPIMDRFTFWVMGRRRPWMIAASLLSALTYISAFITSFDLPNLTELTIICLAISTFTAVMDISVDGLAVDIFPEREQSAANGYMWGSKVFGSAFSAVIVTALFNGYGLSTGLGFTGLVLFSFALVPLLVRERPGEKLLPWTAGKRSAQTLEIRTKSWKHLMQVIFQNVFKRDNLFAAFIIFSNGLAYGYFDALMPALTVKELAWGNDEYSNLAATAGLIGGAVGILLSGSLMKWLGTNQSITLLVSLLIFIPVLLLLQAQLWDNKVLISSFAIAILIVRTLALIAIFALCMALCDRSISATHFALFTTFGNFGISSGSGIFGNLSEFIGYRSLLMAYAAISATTLVGNLWMLRNEKRSKNRVAD